MMQLLDVHKDVRYNCCDINNQKAGNGFMDSMNSQITMSVSGLTRTKDDKAVYVLFTDNDKSAEIAIPGCRVVSNKGFTVEEMNQLMEYVKSEQDTIFEMAKKVNPIYAMMK